eukprot:TRINITY_DN31632_c0_g1_i2.p1 TRINITY_DN31632_c0_g1~~TRINITY_DN31632_c0_g1_i2.p1  ORF type:complete len:343 (+),score=44.95 TRINITY_DN31632_c0_g1_i2:275-1303(+)
MGRVLRRMWTLGTDKVEGCGKVYERQQVQGFTFFIEQGCIDVCAALSAVIASDIAEVVRVLPPAATELLRRKSAVWINNSFQYGHEAQPARGMCTHWSAGWLVPNGNMAEKEGCIECYAAQDWINWRACQPAMLLHELCHAFHKWSPRAVDDVISESYDLCMESGRYDRGEYMCKAIASTATWADGPSCKPYAAANKCEFFSEACEAFFSSRQFRNDFFPYVHAELKGFDPVAYRMVEQAFGIRGEELPTRSEFPQDWAWRFTKLDMSELGEAFQAADKNGDGVLQLNEFVQAVTQLDAEWLTSEEVMAALRFADANNDGVVDYNEFVAWTTSIIGSYIKEG